MARQSASAVTNASHVVLVRLLIALTLITVFLNILFLSPLEEFNVLSSEWTIGAGSIHNTTMHTQNNKLQVTFPKLSEEEGRQHILALFQEAGVELTPEMNAQLPSWSQVQEVIGPHPFLLGLEKCARFRDEVPAIDRLLGSAGMFNTGTNLVTHLLKQNCEIPERREKFGPHQSKESYGMRWQVPWGKHTPAKFRNEHSTARAAEINKNHVLPVVTIRNPYTWFQSMCRNSYTAKWDHVKRRCPELRIAPNGEWNNPVTATFADKREDHHKSLAHLWNDWYSYYVDQADYPFVVVRMEDLVFYPKETTKAVCECAGGKIVTGDEFKFVVDSAKADSPGHDHSTGIFAAWVKYAKKPLPKYGLPDEDYQAARMALDETLMRSLGYRHPSAT